MLAETFEILQRELGKAVIETIQMMAISMISALILGTLLGLLLYITSNQMFVKQKVVNTVAEVVVNVIRSIPFVILMVLCIPLMQALVGTNIGPKAAAIPLSIAAIAFLARLVDGAFREVDTGVIEAALSTGASLPLILRKVVFVEACPGLLRAFTVTFVNLIGFSAMAGLVGGGGIGNLAIQYGYYRYETGVMIITVLILVVVVQVAQNFGDFLAKKATKR